MWDSKGKEDTFFLSLNIPLPSPRQTAATLRFGPPGTPGIAQVPALLKVAAFALELPGTRHMDFSVRKIAVGFFCHWQAEFTASLASPRAT